MEKKVVIGIIGKTHGLRGELTVEPFLPDTTYFKRIGTVFIETENNIESVEIENIREKGHRFIIKLRSFDTIEMVEHFKNGRMTVDRSCIGNPPEGEFFQFDIIGINAITEDKGIQLGVVTNILSTGANDVFVVNNAENEHLIPATNEVVASINIEKREMIVRPLEGMLEDT